MSLLIAAHMSLPSAKTENNVPCLWHSPGFLMYIKFLTITYIKKQIQITHCWCKKKPKTKTRS